MASSLLHLLRLLLAAAFLIGVLAQGDSDTEDEARSPAEKRARLDPFGARAQRAHHTLQSRARHCTQPRLPLVRVIASGLGGPHASSTASIGASSRGGGGGGNASATHGTGTGLSTDRRYRSTAIVPIYRFRCIAIVLDTTTHEPTPRTRRLRRSSRSSVAPARLIDEIDVPLPAHRVSKHRERVMRSRERAALTPDKASARSAADTAARSAARAARAPADAAYL